MRSIDETTALNKWRLSGGGKCLDRYVLDWGALQPLRPDRRERQVQCRRFAAGYDRDQARSGRGSSVNLMTAFGRKQIDIRTVDIWGLSDARCQHSRTAGFGHRFRGRLRLT